MHPNYEKFKVPASERTQFNARLPKELVARLRALASLEGDEVQNLATEAFARLIEARQQEPLVDQAAVRRRIVELSNELSILGEIDADLGPNLQ